MLADTKGLRINEQIRVREVRLVDEEGGKNGIVPWNIRRYPPSSWSFYAHRAGAPVWRPYGWTIWFEKSLVLPSLKDGACSTNWIGMVSTPSCEYTGNDNNRVDKMTTTSAKDFFFIMIISLNYIFRKYTKQCGIILDSALSCWCRWGTLRRTLWNTYTIRRS